MNFKDHFKKFTSSIICHIDGPSGSGKTTIGNKIKKLYPNINVKDLDEFDDEATEILHYTDIKKKDYSDSMLYKLYLVRQKLLDDYIKNTNKKIILVGVFTENPYILNFYTENRFLLNINAEESAQRAYKRSQHESIKEKRKLFEMPDDIKDNQKYIDFLTYNGYKPKSEKEILSWLKTKI